MSEHIPKTAGSELSDVLGRRFGGGLFSNRAYCSVALAVLGLEAFKRKVRDNLRVR